MTSLFDKLGLENVARIDALNRKKQIIAVHHQFDGTCLVLADASKIIFPGLTEDESKGIVGYLGFNGGGQYGLDTPAFAPWIKQVDER
ncbi:Uncharacterised protein [Burkholderia pseudomallei]|nr:Uncharacterised protein [Burkholderia pseudomallei]